MHQISYYVCVFLAAAITASILAHLATLSTELNLSASIVLLLAVLVGAGAFVADDVVCKWTGAKLEQLRFSLFCLAVAVVLGLAVPQLPRLLEVMR